MQNIKYRYSRILKYSRFDKELSEASKKATKKRDGYNYSLSKLKTWYDLIELTLAV